MFLDDVEPADSRREPVRTPLGASLALSIAVVFTLVVGFVPGGLVDMARDAVPALVATAP